MKLKPTIIATIIVLVLSLGLVAALYLVQRSQFFPRQAATPTGVAVNYLMPETATVTLNDTLDVAVEIATGGELISSVQLVYNYQYTGSQPPLSVDQIVPNPTLITDGLWAFPIATISEQNGQGQIRIAAVYAGFQGYKSGATKTVLANLKLVPNRTGTLVLNLDLEQSKIYRKSDSADILIENPIKGTYTVGAPTTTPSPTKAPTSSPTPIPTNTPVPTATPTKAPTQASLNFKFRLDSVTGGAMDLPVRLTLRSTSDQKFIVSAKNNGLGTYSAQVNNIAPGTYTPLLKGPSHLQKQFNNITLTAGQSLNVDWTQKPLLVGDTDGVDNNNDGIPDGNNIVELLDVALLIEKYTDFSIPATPINMPQDVNFDSVIDITDIALVLRTYREDLLDANYFGVLGDN